MSRRKIVFLLSKIVIVILLFWIPLFFTKSPFILHVLIMIGINIILASSLRLIANTGQLSLCHGGMMSIGAYTSALLVTKMGITFWGALPLTGILVLSFASIVGYTFTRLKGIYFAMVTLFLAEVIRLIAEQWRSLTGGISGIIGIPCPDSIIIDGLITISFNSRVAFYYLILILVIITLLILYAIESSRIGNITLLSIKQNESLAESVGVNSAKFKVIAFSIGSFFAGIVGSFYGHYIACISPETFGFLLSLNILVYMIVGGANSFFGPILGAFILTILPEIFRDLKQYMPLVFAGVLAVTVFFLPDGLVSLPQVLRKSLDKRFRHV